MPLLCVMTSCVCGCMCGLCTHDEARGHQMGFLSISTQFIFSFYYFICTDVLPACILYTACIARRGHWLPWHWVKMVVNHWVGVENLSQVYGRAVSALKC